MEIPQGYFTFLLSIIVVGLLLLYLFKSKSIKNIWIMFSLMLVYMFGTMEGANFVIYGNLIEDKFVSDKFMQIPDSCYYINNLDRRIMCISSDSVNNLTYISTVPMGIFAKYQIKGYGQVERGSDLHNFISDKYEKSENLRK